MSKVILISQVPLPYHQIGSWTTLYKNYFGSDLIHIDSIVCEEPQIRFNDINYGIVSDNIVTKIKRRIKKKPHQDFIDTLLKLVEPNEKFIIQIIDNFGFAKALHTSLYHSPEIRKKLYIQFFYHGHDPFYGNFESRWFYQFVDEMVLLTKSSYVKHKNTYTVLPCLFSVFHNGVDDRKFFSISSDQKRSLKKQGNILDKTIFLWCSQDRPKKGLDFILNVWKSLGDQMEDCELWVVGAKRSESMRGVTFFGRILNDDLPKYYQAADVYLFPTLCQEGFGMSLIEALHCECYCIASALGGVPEVLNYGRYGKLIENPHFPDEWKVAILDFLNGKYEKNKLPNEKYTTTEWNTSMNRLITEAKQRML